jgi:hypothetical protein
MKYCGDVAAIIETLAGITPLSPRLKSQIRNDFMSSCARWQDEGIPKEQAAEIWLVAEWASGSPIIRALGGREPQ